jgi:hypothetical protein
LVPNFGTKSQVEEGAVLTGTYSDRIRRFYQEALVGGNWEYARELIAPHARVGAGTGPEAKIEPISQALVGLTDVSVDIRHLVEGRGQVAVHYVLNATDTGGFLGRPPTGKRFSVGDRLLALRGGAGGRKLGGFRLAGPVRPARGGLVAVAHTG